MELTPLPPREPGDHVRVYRGWRCALTLCAPACTRSPSIVHSSSFQQARSVREQLEAEGYVFEGEGDGPGAAAVEPETSAPLPAVSPADCELEVVVDPLTPLCVKYGEDGVMHTSPDPAASYMNDEMLDDCMYVHIVEL